MARPRRDSPAPVRPAFHRLPPGLRLRVPSDVGATGDRPAWLPAGTSVAAGDPLVAGPSSAAHAIPVAPVAGVVGSAATARLVGRATVHAVELVPTDPELTDGHDPGDGAGSASPDQAAAVLADVTPADLGTWLSTLHRLGVSADRWTCPDLLGQLRQALRRPVDTVACNLLDSDPWLAVSRTVAVAFPLELAAGIGLLGRLTAAKDWWALADQADDAALAGVRKAAAVVAKGLRVAAVANDYPQPDPTLLTLAATGRRLRPGRLPTEQGVLMVDAAAAVAVGRAALAGAPQLRVPVVLYDQPGDAAFAVEVCPGTAASTVLGLLGVPWAVREVYAGSPLRQLRARPDDVLGPGELALFAAPPQPAVVPEPCVRCGWCADGCPTRCRPAALLEAAQQHDVDLARLNGLDACIECGLCSYVCPSRLPLLDGIRRIKREAAGAGGGE